MRGRHLSLIVWTTTLGAVAGPQFAALAGAALDGYGVPTLAGPFFFSALLFGLAALCLLLLLRPDPAILARSAGENPSGRPAPDVGTGMRAALRAVVSQAPATLGVSATAIGHMVMVGDDGGRLHAADGIGSSGAAPSGPRSI